MKRIIAVAMMICMLMVCGIPASAQTVTQDGLTATLTTDKRSYNEGESVSVSLTLDNANADDIHLTDAYYVLPDFLGGGTAPIDLNALAAQQSTSLGASFTVAVPPQAGDLPETGDSSMLMLWTLLLAVSVFAFTCLDRDAQKRMMSLILCFAMLSGMLPIGGGAEIVYADENIRTLTVSETVSLMRHETQITAVIRYELPADEAAAAGAPTGISGIGTAANKAYLRWKAAESAEGYEIYRSKTRTGTYSKCAETTGTGRSVSTYAGMLNFFKIRSYVTENGARVYSPYSAVYVMYPLTVPTGLTATVANTGAITVKWNAVTNAQKYVLFYSAEENGTYTRLVTTGARSRTMTELPGGLDAAYFKVYAQRTDGSVTSVSNYTSPVYVEELMDAPSNISGMGTATNRAYFRWNAVEGARGYEVWRSTSANGTYTKCATTGATSRSVTFSKANAVNYVKIRAYKVVNGANVYGKYSEPYAIYPLAAPASLTATVAASGAVMLKWSAVTNAQRYALFYSDRQDGSYKRLVTTAAKAYAITELPGDLETAYFKVYAQRTDSGVTSVSNYSPVERAVKPVPIDYTYHINNGSVILFSYTGGDTDIEIPTAVEGYPVTSIGGYMFQNNSSITSVTIPESVTSIGGYAFANCASLKKVHLPSRLKEIDGGTFRDCVALEIVNIPDTVTRIGDYAFGNCVSLTSITLPQNLTVLREGAFSGCVNLVGSLTLPSGLTKIDNRVFMDCAKLTGPLNIPSGVTSIGEYAFNDCSGLTGSLNIPAGVTSIGERAFDDCSGFSGSLIIPDSVAYIGKMAFYNCSGFTGSLSVPGTVEIVEEKAFYSCSGLEEVKILEGITTIGTSAFALCTNLKSVTIPRSVTNIDTSAFTKRSTLTIYGYIDSAAQRYATAKGIAFVALDAPESTPVPNPVTYRALLLNNVYDGSDAPLPGTDTDVKAIKNMLNNMSATAYTVYNGRELTATQMLNKIDDVFSLADDNDVTLLHYSGHGADFSDVDAYDGSLCGINNTYITPTQLRTALDQYKGKKIIMLDSCFSGNMIASSSGLNIADDQEQTDAYVNAFVNAFSMRTRSNLAADSYYVIAACSKTQTSGELTFTNNSTGESISCGFFTLALTDGCGWDLLGGTRLSRLYADANSDSQITLNEAYNHVVDYVEDFVAENPGFTSQSTQVYPPNSAQVLFGR